MWHICCLFVGLKFLSRFSYRGVVAICFLKSFFFCKFMQMSRAKSIARHEHKIAASTSSSDNNDNHESLSANQ